MSHVVHLIPPTFDPPDARAALEDFGLVELLRACALSIDRMFRTEAYLLSIHPGWRNRSRRREIKRGMEEARQEMRRRMALLVSVAKACAEELT